MTIFKRYILTLCALAFVLPALYAASYYVLISAGIPIQKIPYEALYEYQNSKAKNSDASVIFVGDSALGYAINATQFSKLSGLKSENYALTGKFGYKGSKNSIRNVLNHNKNLTTVIIFHTLDMSTRMPAADYKPAFQIGFFDTGIFNFKTLEMIAQALLNPQKSVTHKNAQIVNDYIPQSETNGRTSDNTANLIPSAIRQEKIAVLRSIAKLCKDNGLKCLYVHAPLNENLCQNAGEFITYVNREIENAGLKAAPATPLCLTDAQTGNTPDHVKPSFKDTVTKEYYNRLKNSL